MRFINYLIILLIFISLVLIGYTQLPTGLAIDPIEDNETGLVALWHMNEGTGSTISDSSGNGNTGTINGATWVDGKFGKALSFDGVDDYVDAGNDASVKVTEDLTISFWVNFKAVNPDKRTHGILYTYHYQEYSVSIDTLYAKIWFSHGNGTNYEGAQSQSTSILQNVNEWHKVDIVRTTSPKNITFYVDGVQLSKHPWNINFISSTWHPLQIGRSNVGFLNGTLDEVAIYDRALSASEIKAHYNKGMGEEPPPSPECGNNIKENGEECDGTDDTACPGNCLLDCTCQEEPPEEQPPVISGPQPDSLSYTEKFRGKVILSVRGPPYELGRYYEGPLSTEEWIEQANYIGADGIGMGMGNWWDKSNSDLYKIALQKYKDAGLSVTLGWDSDGAKN